MRTRGRHSMEDLLIKDGGLAADTRPDVPYDLDDDAAIEWRRVINSMPPDHFIPANYHMLILLCQEIVEARRISRLIASYCQRKSTVDVKVYLELLKQKDVIIASISKLSTKCRLTQQSTKNTIAVNLKRGAAQQVDMSGDDSW